MDGWALDLGTTNSGVARWDREADQAQLVELPAVCRLAEGDDPLAAPRVVPSAVLAAPGLVARDGVRGRLSLEPSAPPAEGHRP
jgi:hypothetical protein